MEWTSSVTSWAQAESSA